ncbi:MDR family MFS transporter [Ligilactobacillus pobuzihii]|uniref:Major facilitator superfamily permease n=1 Tax=Ligilactobacillus pobuzihii TaxID=449659 RepID=A0A0R2L9M5_9LACO|nr:major facilitator superfamily permease [Ligilactobacillus pobuzihii E100301 = KCTC 13174]KRN98498.1 major facilitator superfamily permease [Ligilactobacillus pobuzihii]GEN48523.1 MFS transporter [Ligilactobacillus pobuzihii]
MSKTADNKMSGFSKTMMIIVLLIGTFCTVLNQTLLATALPKLMSTFDVSTATVQWLTTGFLMVNGIMIPLSAYLATTINTKLLYISAMTVFLGGTILAYVAPTFGVLLAGRLVQALGVGIAMPLLQTIMLSIFPPEKRGAALGLVGIVIGVAPAIGPTLSGWIIDKYQWRDLFGMIIPIMVVVIILALFFMKPVIKTHKQKIDWLSLVLSTIGFGGLLYGFSSAGNDGWTSTKVLVSLIVGAIVTALFVWRQLVIPKPFLELRVFKTGEFTLSAILSSIVMIAMLGVETVLPLYLQIAHGMSALHSGLTLLSGAVVMALMSPITGKTFDAFGGKRLALTGMVILTVATAPFLWLTIDTPTIYIVFLYAVRMFGISMVMMPVTTSGMNALPNSLIADGTASNNTVRQVASSIGSAIMITLLTNVTNNAEPAAHLLKEAPLAYKHQYLTASLDGYHAAFAFSLVFAIIGVVLTFFLKDQKHQPHSKDISEKDFDHKGGDAA